MTLAKRVDNHSEWCPDYQRYIDLRARIEKLAGVIESRDHIGKCDEYCGEHRDFALRLRELVGEGKP